MERKSSRWNAARVISTALVVALTGIMQGATALHAFENNGCMAERTEFDVFFGNTWHGALGVDPPTTGCDLSGECDWGEERDAKYVDEFHVSWVEGGIEDHGHTSQQNPPSGCSIEQ